MTLVDISFKTAGRMTELTVREGDTVKKGQVIARLDAAQLEQQRLRDMAAVASAQSTYDQLKTTIEYQQATIDSDISTRQAELAQQQAHLDELNAGSRHAGNSAGRFERERSARANGSGQGRLGSRADAV